MGSPVCFQILGASALGAQTELSSGLGVLALLQGLTHFLIACLPGNAGRHPPVSSHKSPPMDRIAADPTRPTAGQAVTGLSGFRQTPLTCSILVLEPYVFIISDSAICHESLTIRIVRHLTKSFSDATK